MTDVIIKHPPPNAHQIELINKIWDMLEKLFGKEKAKNQLKSYIEYNDGRFKQISELAVKLEELRQLVAKKDRKTPDPKLLPPGDEDE